MPVVLRIRGFKFWFYEADLDEPPHVHAGKENREAKFWLAPVRVAHPGRCKSVELREIERIIDEHHDFLVSVWEKEQRKRADR